ncbi:MULTISPECIES: hypothetical protein [unclassified Microcoleus]|uniref:ribbon-helix-helix domain-containing protein n=1 Tax=unclassified Microcoleus TaxID=2642155 RepID=UPI002FD72657
MSTLKYHGMHSKSTLDGKIDTLEVKKRYNRAVKAQITALPAKLPRIVVYLPEEVKADLERLAKSHYRPVSNMVLSLIQEALDRAKSEGRIPSDNRSQPKSDNDEQQ